MQTLAPIPDPVEPNVTVPQRCEVVVVGAGIAGASTAFALARQGVPTVLCEKGIVAGEQSSRNWGWVRKMHRDPRELPLMLESARIWDGLNESLGAETGFRRSGITYLCETSADAERYEDWLEQVRSFDLDSRLISRAEIDALFPGCRGSWQSAFYTASDARAEPQKATSAIARGAQNHGTTVLDELCGQRCRVIWRTSFGKSLPKTDRSLAAPSSLPRGRGPACCVAASDSAFRN